MNCQRPVAPTLDLQGGEQVLDACAAPGGKTAHIASYLTTGQVTALDLYDHKLDLIQENAQRLGVADRVQTQKLDDINITNLDLTKQAVEILDKYELKTHLKQKFIVVPIYILRKVIGGWC